MLNLENQIKAPGKHLHQNLLRLEHQKFSPRKVHPENDVFFFLIFFTRNHSPFSGADLEPAVKPAWLTWSCQWIPAWMCGL